MPDPSSDPTSKFGASQKKSFFERQKQEAEAKKAREKAETAAVLQDFVKSFDEDADPSTSAANARTSRQSNTAAGYGSGPGKRHFTSSGLKSGPGSLGSSLNQPRSGPGGLGSAASSGRKRQYDDYTGRRDYGRERYSSYGEERSQGPERLEDETSRDVDDDRAAAKPTLHLSSLPPGTSPAVVKAILASTPLSLENVRIIPSAVSTDRKSSAAIVTLAADTAAADIDNVVSQLQNRYLGFGFNLSISRHLSSAALGNTQSLTSSSLGLNNLPFGAKTVVQHVSLSRAPPPGQGRFAPPASYTSSTPYHRSNAPSSQVTVQPPSDLKQLKLIHKTLEALLTYGPEFEALLMSRPQIQQAEQWSWLFNPRSAGGVYYRWRLWEILTNSSNRRRGYGTGIGTQASSEFLFEGQSAWSAPEESLRFEYVTELPEFVSDDQYNSSDEEEDDDGGIARRYNDHNATSTALDDTNDGLGYLNPLAKTKLIHLLSRLPDSTSKLRRGDVARITAFAIEHAGAGADEVSMLVTRNILQPFHTSVTSKPAETDTTDAANDLNKPDPDTTSSMLVGLYVISDILSASASSGVRHAWRYRNLIEAALREQQIFSKLGRIDKDLGWGKLRAERFRHSVSSILHLWEGWSAFPSASHEAFADAFANPPMTEKEQEQLKADEARKAEEEARKSKVANRWRSVEDEKMDVDMDDVDGKQMVDTDDEDAGKRDAVPDPEVDGWSLPDSSDEEQEEELKAQEPDEKDAEDKERADSAKQRPEKTSRIDIDMTTGGRRMRPKAVDMFADDADEE